MTNFIVQAGGLGSRMQNLTSSKPKCLIPIDGKPILFHLIDNNPDARFIIILDYEAEVLINYVRKFRPNAKVIYTFSTIKTTSAGIKEASSYFKDEPFFVIWSDLLVKQKIETPLTNKDICVGLTNKECSFPCRWSVVDGKLVKEASNENGIAGLFWIKSSSCLDKLDEIQSFTTFLTTKDVDFFNIKGMDDVGSSDKFYSLHKNNRFFNKLTFNDTTVKKEAIVKEYEKLIDDEIFWYKHLQKFSFERMPALISEKPLVIQRLMGNNPFNYTPNKEFILDCISTLKQIHSFESTTTNIEDLKQVYLEKTFERINEVSDIIPFFDEEMIRINHRFYFNPFHKKNVEQFKKEIETLYSIDVFNLIHGDSTFSNIISVNNKTYFIDPRGYFGKSKLYGDARYDWAKLYYSLVGNYDNVNSKNYFITVKRDMGVKYWIGDNGWEKYETLFFDNIPYSKEEIKLIHVLIWFSLCGYVKEDYSSILLSFYNGVVLWNELHENF